MPDTPDPQGPAAERHARRMRDVQRRLAAAVAVTDPAHSAELIDEAVARTDPTRR